MTFLLNDPTVRDAELRGRYVGKHRKTKAGNTGDEEKEYEFEPFPETEPIKEPSPAPAPQPVPA